MTEKNLFKRNIPKPPTIAKADFCCATVTEVTSTGIRILVDGETEPTNKVYKQISSARSIETGDRVVAMLQNGTYIILGTIGYPGDMSTVINRTIAEIAVAATGWNITSAVYAQWGKVAMLSMNISSTEQVTITASDPIATVAAGKRPAVDASARVWLSTSHAAVIRASGNVLMTAGTIAANSGYTLLATYLLP